MPATDPEFFKCDSPAENSDEAEWTDEDWANAVTTEQLSP